jgi:dolichol kinase
VATSPQTPSSRSFLKGSAALVIAAVVVAILVIAYPAYRWFFLISVGIGLGVAALLFFWHRLRPIREEDVVENKRPLGLD